MTYIDIVIVALYLVITLALGLWQGKGIKSMRDYTVSHRNYSTFVIVATLAASWFGGGSTIGKIEKIFNHGTVFLLSSVGVTIQLLLMSEIIVKKFKPYMGLLTIGDIMGKMYGRQAKVITGFLGIVVSLGFLGSQLAAIGYFMTTIFDISLFWAIIIAYGIVVLYSSFGGIKSVAVTDVLQFIIIAVTIPTLVLLILKNYNFNFLNNIPANKLNFSEISYDNYKYFYMMLVITVPTFIPMSVQRILMSKDVNQSISSFRWAVIILVLVSIFMTIIALVACIYMPNENANQILPIMIRDLIPIGFRGLVIAGFLSVIMSSADSFLHSSGVCLVHDFLKPLIKNKLLNKSELILTKILTFAIGTFSIIVALYTDSLVDTIYRGYGFWMPAVLIPLLAGLFSFRKSKEAYYASVIFGGIAVAVCMYFSMVNVVVTLIGVVFSFTGYLLFGKRVY